MPRPKSRGVIRLRSSDPFAPPIIQANYLTDQQDVDTMVAGLKVGLQLIETDAFKVYHLFCLQKNQILGFSALEPNCGTPIPSAQVSH